MKILQLNVGRSRGAHDLLWHMATDKLVDFLLVSEPNRKLVEGDRWRTDRRGDAAIGEVSRLVAVERSGSGDGFVWVELAGVVVYSCYISPNIRFEEYVRVVGGVLDDVERWDKDVMVVGDFNAKSVGWGGVVTDARGAYLADAVAALGLVCLNEGTSPTFERGDYGSYIDVTFATEGVARKVLGWSVLDEETLSGHRCISYEVEEVVRLSMGVAPRWQVSEDGLARFKLALGRQIGMVNIMGPESLTEVVAEVCEETLGSRRTRGRKSVYWWTAGIAELRAACMRARRRMQRARDFHDREALREELRVARSTLRKEIVKVKRVKWAELCCAVEDDPWGDAYKIVTKKFGRTLPVLTKNQLRGAVERLFPRRSPGARDELVADEIPLFTVAELREASKRMKAGKSPGPDGIPVEVVKATVEVIPLMVLWCMNDMIVNEWFPEGWKRARLVLLRKGGRLDGDPGAFRPLCLLNTFGKLFEQLLVKRLKKEVERCGGLSDDQYGFREGRSAVTAVERVMSLVDAAAEGSRYTRQIPVVIMFDVKNAFNSLPWGVILEELKRRQVKPYLRRIIQQYLSERTVVGTAEGVEIVVEMTCGVPQGSVLGPDLWNVGYDGVLRIEYPEGVTAVGFADDLAVVVVARTEEQVVERANRAIERICTWLGEKGLELAVEKTVAIVMGGRRKLGPIVFNVGNSQIRPVEKAKYLGVWLDKRRSFQAHVIEVVDKAERTAAALCRLMTNVGGPRQKKRRLFGSVVDSVVLYAEPCWARALYVARAKGRLERLQRRMALRVCSAYRTVSAEAAFVVAGVPPMELLAVERGERYLGVGKAEARERLLEKWQRRWQTTEVGRWTFRLIPEIKRWFLRGHGEVNFQLTQFLTGHGCFSAYLYGKGRRESGDCIYCGEDDTASHTILSCVRWEEYRRVCRCVVGVLEEATIVEKMLLGQKEWTAIETMIVSIVRSKMAEE